MSAAPRTPTAVFRCEAGPGFGYGHFMRCSALAYALRERAWRSLFAMSEASAMLPVVARAGGETILLPADRLEDPAALRRDLPGGVDWVIVDHYGLASDYERGLRPWASQVGCFEDLDERRHAADLVVGCCAPVRQDEGPVCLAGPAYAAIRRSFVDCRRAMKGPGAIRDWRAVIGFGAIDGRGLSLPSARIALDVLAGWRIDVVTGRDAASADALRALAAEEDRMTLHVDMDDPAPLFARASLAIGAGGMSALERCVVGLPSIMVTVADNQAETVDGIIAAGAACRIAPGDTYDDELRRTLEAMTADVRQRMAAKAWAYCDGDGARRIADAMEMRLH